MRHSCISKILFFLMMFVTHADAKPKEKSAIVYYHNDISWSILGLYDYIIVEPDHIETDTDDFRNYADKVYAYVSLGEVSSSRNYFSQIKQSWLLGENRQWGSKITNLADKEYRTFILHSVIKPLYEKGFRNFFFDTLDSYRIVIKNNEKLEEQIDGLSSLIHEIHKLYPKSHLVMNRGFDIFDKVKDDIDAVLFESYYNGLDTDLNYKKIDKDAQVWLDAQLLKIKQSGKDIIVVDYLKSPHSEEAKKSIKKLQDKGFIPYISNKELNIYGISSTEASKLKQDPDDEKHRTERQDKHFKTQQNSQGDQ